MSQDGSSLRCEMQLLQLTRLLWALQTMMRFIPSYGRASDFWCPAMPATWNLISSGFGISSASRAWAKVSPGRLLISHWPMAIGPEDSATGSWAKTHQRAPMEAIGRAQGLAISQASPEAQGLDPPITGVDSPNCKAGSSLPAQTPKSTQQPRGTLLPHRARALRS